MLIAFAIVPPTILAVVLLTSAFAKLRSLDDEAGWAELGVPETLRRAWLMRLHPFGEIVVGIALLTLGGVPGAFAAVAATVLFVVYLVLIWRARRLIPEASCACFGERTPITARTLLRNGWLVVLSLAALSGVGALPTFGGVLALLPVTWPWMLSLAAVAVSVVLIAGRSGASLPGSGIEPVTAPDEGDLGDYLRTHTPAVPVILGDGSLVNLRALASRKPILLLAVSETCGSCLPVIERADDWRSLLPEVSVRFLLRAVPEQSGLTSASEPQTLHDPDGYVRDSIAEWRTPTAVLLGADGMLAGGPVSGLQDITGFIGDVYESLQGIRPEAG